MHRRLLTIDFYKITDKKAFGSAKAKARDYD